jgi:hypothetical protein
LEDEILEIQQARNVVEMKEMKSNRTAEVLIGWKHLNNYTIRNPKEVKDATLHLPLAIIPFQFFVDVRLLLLLLCSPELLNQCLKDKIHIDPEFSRGLNEFTTHLPCTGSPFIPCDFLLWTFVSLVGHKDKNCSILLMATTAA